MAALSRTRVYAADVTRTLPCLRAVSVSGTTPPPPVLTLHANPTSFLPSHQVSTKIGVIEALLQQCDKLVLG